MAGATRTGPVLLVLLLAAAAHGQYIEAILPMPAEPRHLLWEPVHEMVYCACLNEGKLAVINGTSNELEAVLEVGVAPGAMLLDTGGGRLLVANRGG
ncbi:MAG TPA: hypothetical protein ENN51_09585, partial [candidate division WOR-3 bacterium]|nr:hypothetical protein [candidate division WOR-3 bacterium]